MIGGTLEQAGRIQLVEIQGEINAADGPLGHIERLNVTPLPKNWVPEPDTW